MKTDIVIRCWHDRKISSNVSSLHCHSIVTLLAAIGEYGTNKHQIEQHIDLRKRFMARGYFAFQPVKTTPSKKMTNSSIIKSLFYSLDETICSHSVITLFHFLHNCKYVRTHFRTVDENHTQMPTNRPLWIR